MYFSHLPQLNILKEATEMVCIHLHPCPLLRQRVLEAPSVERVPSGCWKHPVLRIPFREEVCPQLVNGSASWYMVCTPSHVPNYDIITLVVLLILLLYPFRFPPLNSSSTSFLNFLLQPFMATLATSLLFHSLLRPPPDRYCVLF